MASPPLQPTYQGLVMSTYDALVLFEACLRGNLHHVPRRPHDRERADLIVSGNIFIYEEHSSGIKRWTDGISWSPSRILGNFLVYRELCQNFGHGEKKRALKKPINKRPSSGGVTKPNPSASASMTTPSSTSTQTAFPSQRLSLSATSSFDDSSAANGATGANGEAIKDPLRDLVGSLTDSYDFKENGLVKKTISIRYRGISHHLVSYYSIEDALENRLGEPSKDSNLFGIQPREELVFSQTFRTAITDSDFGQQTASGSYITANGYMAIPHHPVDGVPIGYAQQGYHAPQQSYHHAPYTSPSYAPSGYAGAAFADPGFNGAPFATGHQNAFQPGSFDEPFPFGLSNGPQASSPDAAHAEMPQIWQSSV